MKHPYSGAPPHTKWRSAVGQTPMLDVDPAIGFPFRVSRQDRVATAGSCFSQHIGRALKANGYTFLVTEHAHPFIENVADEHAYNQFSARYGNVYTTRQMLQLIQRAFGLFEPIDDAWISPEGTYFDPFRPAVQPGGFASAEELRDDRARHLGCVREMVRNLDYLVFTLGLTEVWVSARDGATYPLCPGVAAGSFDPAEHRMVNLTVDEIVADALSFFALIESLNPSARMILTVSPVAMMATAQGQHILTANTYSKAVLRVAAETLARRNPDKIAYFPSYELIAGVHTRAGYVMDDLRSVSDEGVARVMQMFARHATDGTSAAPAALATPASRQAEMLADLSRVVKAECDEEMLDLPAVA